MTIHRIDEAIVLVAWRTGRSFGLLHVQRPRSQKGVGYCGIRIPLDGEVHRMNRITISDPHTFPLEVRPERDLRRLCSKCAKGFGDCVAEDYAGLEWVDVPDVWRAILARAHRPPVSVDLSKRHPMLNPTPSAADLEADKQRRQDWQLVRDSRIQHTTDELEDPTTEGDRRREVELEELKELERAAEHDLDNRPHVGRRLTK